jgi:hypothetical protein
MIVTANSLLTPAELVAASQVSVNGVQKLTLSSSGNAVGGRFSLTGTLSQSLSNLVIPQNVKLLENFANTPGLSLSGNLIDDGTFIAFSSTSKVSAANIFADNIYVQAGAVLTSVLDNSTAGGSNVGAQHVVPALSLSLSALNNVVNAGTIASSGSLSVSAGGSKNNGAGTACPMATPLLPTGQPGQPVANSAGGSISSSAGGSISNGTNGSITNSTAGSMQAQGDVNLIALGGNFTNGGTVKSINGSINLNTADTADLVVNNSSGVMQALQGNINVRNVNYTGNANINLNGGNWFSQALNLNGGQGTVSANLNQVSGTVNVTAAQVHLQAATSNLLLGNMNISGDPSYYNTIGDVTLSGSLIFSGQDLAIIANQDIVSTASLSIDTSNASGNGGNILFVAGAGNYYGGSFTVTNPDGTQGNASANNDTTTAITLQGQSSTGGLIDLAQSGGLTSITTASKGGNGNGGNITMIAYTGTGSGNPPLLPAGSITLPATSTLTTSGNGSGANGNILIIAGAGQAEPPLPMFQVITLGGITATGGTGGGGVVTIAAAEPSTTGPNGYVQIINGTVQPGSDTYIYSNIFAGSVTIGSSAAGISANQLKVIAGGNLVINGQVTANGGITLTTYGNGILAGSPSGSLNSTGAISISLGTTATTTVATTLGQITINQGGPSLIIGTTPSNIASLSIASGNDITVANNINIGGTNSGVLTLDTTANNPYSNNIFLNGSLSANGGINLIVAGTGVISAANGSLINSTGPISLTLGVANASLSSVSGNIVINQATTSVVVGSASQVSSLTVNFGGNISVATPLTLGGTNSGSLTLYAQSGSGTAVIPGNGNIILANNITANGGISLTTGGTGVIGGAGTLNSSGQLALEFGTGPLGPLQQVEDLTIASSPSGNITITQGTSRVTIGTIPSALASLTVNAPVNIATLGTIAIGGGASGSLLLNSSAGNVTLGGPITANAGITLSAGGTIAGSVNSASFVSVNFLTETGSATTLSEGVTSFSISHGGQTLAIGNSTAALTINSADAISVTTAITVNGSLSLASAQAGTISYGTNNLTANGGITLSFSGQGAIGGGTGSLNTSGAVNLNFDSGQVTLGSAGNAINVSQGTAVITINNSNLSSLSINADGGIATASNVGIGAGNTGLLRLISNTGNIVLNNTVTANSGITLAVSGSNTIAGTGTLTSTGTLTVNLGSSGSSSLNTQVGALTTLAAGASLTVFQSGPITLTTNNLGSGALSVIASASINVAQPVTAVSISLQASAGVIGGSGQLISSGYVDLWQSANLTLASSNGNLQIFNGTSTLTVGQVNNLASLAITSTGTISTTNAIALNGTLSLESLSASSGVSISLGGSVSANSAIVLTATGQGTIAGSPANSIYSAGPILINLGNGNVPATTVALASGNITINQGSSALTIGTAPAAISSLAIASDSSITVTSPITIGGSNSGILALTSTTAGNNISLGANTLTANGGLTLSVSGSGTISATTGTINSTGPITLNLGTPDVTLSASGQNITMSQGGSTLTIGTQANSLSSLSVNAGGSITVASALTIGGATSGDLLLATFNGNIAINGNITANDVNGISLLVSGSGTISGTGSLNSAGNVSLSFGNLPATINSSQAGATVTAGSATANIGNFDTLNIFSLGDIIVGNALNFPSQSFSFTSSGKIVLNSDITSNNLTLQVTGSGTIGGSGSINCATDLVINLGSNSAVLTSPFGNLVVTDNTETITTTSDAFFFSLTAPLVTVNSNVTISVPSNFYLHTNTLAVSGTISQNYPFGWIQIDNSGLAGGLTLTNTGSGSALIQNTTDGGATINILDFNGQGINFNSSYTIKPNDGTSGFGIVRIWEATYSTSYPNINSPVAFSTIAANYANIIVNPISGQINFSPNVTVSAGTYFILSAPTIVISSGASIATSSAEIILLHTNNLIDNSVSSDGSLSSITTSVADGFIQIDDQGMNPNLPLTISGAGTPATPAWFSNTSSDGGPIIVVDFHGQQVNFNASTTMNAGVNCDDVSGAWQESIGGDAMPVAGEEGLESSPTSGSIVLAPNVTVTVICGEEVEFDAPTQVYNKGSQFIDKGVTTQDNQLTIEAIHFTNNGQIIDQVPNSLLGIVNDDDSTPSPADADIEGPIQIYGTGSVSATGAGGIINVATEGPGQPTAVDPVVFYGNQTFSADPNTYIFFQANRNIAFANSSVQTILSGGLAIDAPMTTNNGTVAVSGGGNIYFQNSSATTEHTLVTNNGVISNGLASSASTGIYLIGSTSTVGNTDTTVNGTGSFLTAGSNISITSPTGTTLAIAGSPTFNAGSGSVLFSSGNSKLPITFGDGNAETITVEGGGVNLTAGKVTLNNLVSLNLIGTSSQTQSGVIFNTSSIAVTPGGSATLSITTFDLANTKLGTGTTVNVGAGTVSLLPVSTSELIVIGGYGGNFSVPATALSAITAANVIIGNNMSAAGITLGGSYTMPKSGSTGLTAGLYNLDLENNGAGGTFSGNGNSLNMSSQDLTITVASTISTGSGMISGTTGSIYMSVTGPGNGLAVGSGGIAETAGGNITLSTVGAGAISGSGLISSTGTTTLDSQTGNIGTASANLRLSTTNLVTSSQANVYLTDNSSVTITSPSTAGNFLLIDTATNGAITFNSSLTAVNSLTLQSGLNGNVNLNANLSASSVTITAGGSGAVTQSTGLIAGNSVTLVSGTGSLGTQSQALQINASGSLSANTSGAGTVYLEGSTPLLNNSSSGGNFQIVTVGSLAVNNIYSANGGIAVSTNSGTLKVLAGATINAAAGNVSLQNEDANLGKIFIDSNATVQAGQNTSCTVSIFLGTAPPPQNAGSTPTNVTASTSGGGQIFFGNNGLVANTGNNFVYASGNGAEIIFDTGNEGASAITLNGGTTIYANAHQFTPLTSLDLTNKATVSLISNLQLQGLVGGQLTVVNGIAVGGTLTLEGGELGNLTAMNIPQNVQVTLDDFQTFNAINVNLNSTSTTKQVLINGQELFTGTPTTNAIININSLLSGIVLNTGGSSLINTAGQLALNANGSITIGGGLSGTVSIATTANNGHIALNGNVGTAGKTFAISLNGSGGLSQASGKTITAGNLTISAGTGSIGSTTTAIQTQVNSLSTTGNATININNVGAINILSLSANFFKLTDAGSITTSAIISAPTVTLSNAAAGAPAANISIGANILASTSDTLISSEDIDQTSGTISGNALTLTAANGDIGLAQAIATAVQSLMLTAGNGADNNHTANISNLGNLKVLAAATGTLSIKDSGNLSIAGAATANSVSLSTANNGSVALGANVGKASGTTVISANGSGTVMQSSGLVYGAQLTLGSLTSTGSIGSLSKNIATAASSTLTLNTSGSGNIYDSNNQAVQLMSSQAGGNFALATTGGLTANSITTNQGSISLKASGSVLQINSGTTLFAQGGSITLQNTNTSTGSIAIGAGATVHASATAASLGVVDIYLGTAASPLTPGPTPNHVVVTTEPGGQVYFGTKGITTSAPNNLLNANGRNIVFSTSSAPATKINLGGSVTITADPPATTAIEYDKLETVDGESVADTGDFTLNEEDAVVIQVSQ